MIVPLTLGAAAAVLLVYEGFALLTGRKTVSEIVWAANKAYPPLGFLVGLPLGVILGHLFWTQ